MVWAAYQKTNVDHEISDDVDITGIAVRYDKDAARTARRMSVWVQTRRSGRGNAVTVNDGRLRVVVTYSNSDTEELMRDDGALNITAPAYSSGSAPRHWDIHRVGSDFEDAPTVNRVAGTPGTVTNRDTSVYTYAVPSKPAGVYPTAVTFYWQPPIQ